MVTINRRFIRIFKKFLTPVYQINNLSMKKIYFLIWLSSHVILVHAQVSVGSSPMYILNGTTFSTEGLELIPSVNTTIATNQIQLTTSVVNGTPRQSIQRVYVIDSTLSYAGTIRLHYVMDELNGNSEPSLTLQYARNGNWYELGGTANTTDKYVSFVTPSPLQFSKMTAAETLTALPLVANTFVGVLRTGNVVLEWKISNNNLYKGFQLEKSNSNGQWTVAGYIQSFASTLESQLYSYLDNDLKFEKRLYRLRMDLKSGGQSYSNIISISNKTINDKVSIVPTVDGLDIHFTDKLPKQLNMFSQNGQLMYKSQQSSAIYHIKLPIGIYQLQYNIDGVVYTKQVFAR